MRLFYFIYFIFPFVSAFSTSEHAQALYLLHVGKVKEAFSLYADTVKITGTQDLKTLERLSLGLIKNGLSGKEDSVQLLSLYSATISEHEEAEKLVATMLESPSVEHKLLALNFLARKKSHITDLALYQVFRTGPLILRLEAAFHLVQRGYAPIEDELESLLHRAPPIIHPIFPQLIAPIKSRRALSLMRRFMHDKNLDVRKEAVSLACRYQRDDLLRDIHALATHADPLLQECCAHAFGVMEDTKSIPWLLKQTESEDSNIALVAANSLNLMKDPKGKARIKEMALEGNLFAISLLAKEESAQDILLELLQSSDRNVVINSAIALLEQGDPRCMPYLKELYRYLSRGVGMIPQKTPGKTLMAWVLRPVNDPKKMNACLGLYSKIIALSAHVLLEEEYLPFAQFVLESEESSFVPVVMASLIDIGSNESLNIVRSCTQSLGAPHLRCWATLSLFKVEKSAVQEDVLVSWMQEFCQKEAPLVDMSEKDALDFGNDHFSIQPLDAFKLFLEMMDTYVAAYPEKGVELLVTSMQEAKEQYYPALAGLLLRAMQ